MRVDVAVIGGGFSGSAVAAQLARRAPADFSLALFEPGELGRGAAYGTRHDEHVLNTRAYMMSLFPEEPDHFVRWLGPRGGAMDFASRRLYGTYVNEVAGRAFERPAFTLVKERAISVRRTGGKGFVVESGAGTQFEARAVVLATGNARPHDSFLPKELLKHPGYIADPWRFDYRVVGGHVLVVGSGLTALDVLVALRSVGHRGGVHIVSRHARFPEVHGDGGIYDVIPALDTQSAHGLLHSFRRQLETAAGRGYDWRSVVDAIRPEAEAIWKRVPLAEQRRFERHLRTHWDRHRHRAPQQVDGVRLDYQRSKRLFTYAGTVRDVARGNVTIALRTGGTIGLRPDWIVNCSGVGRASAMARDPLLADLLAGGDLSVTPEGLGFRTTFDLNALDATATPAEDLWILGTPVRGSRFEATAVPELRGMAETISAQILHSAARGHAQTMVRS